MVIIVQNEITRMLYINQHVPSAECFFGRKESKGKAADIFRDFAVKVLAPFPFPDLQGLLVDFRHKILSRQNISFL